MVESTPAALPERGPPGRRWRRGLLIAYLVALGTSSALSAGVLASPRLASWFYRAVDRTEAWRTAARAEVAAELDRVEEALAAERPVDAAAIASAVAAELAPRGAAWEDLQVRALEGLAEAELRRERLEGVRFAHRGLLRLQPRVAGRHAALGTALALLGQPAPAERALRAALDLDPNCLAGVEPLVELLLASGRDAEALAVFARYRDATALAQAPVEAHPAEGPALRLWAGSRAAGAWRCAPRIDGRPQRLRVPLVGLAPGPPLRLLTLDLELPAVCGEVELGELVLHPPPDLRGGEPPPPLLELRDWSPLRARGALRLPDGSPERLSVQDREVRLALPLPQPLDPAGVDRLELVITLRKREPPRLLAQLAAARQRAGGDDGR